MWIVRGWFKTGKIFKLKLDESRGQTYKIEGDWLTVYEHPADSPNRYSIAWYKKGEWASTLEQAKHLVSNQTLKRVKAAENLLHKLRTMEIEVVK